MECEHKVDEDVEDIRAKERHLEEAKKQKIKLKHAEEGINRLEEMWTGKNETKEEGCHIIRHEGYQSNMDDMLRERKKKKQEKEGGTCTKRFYNSNHS